MNNDTQQVIDNAAWREGRRPIIFSVAVKPGTTAAQMENNGMPMPTATELVYDAPEYWMWLLIFMRKDCGVAYEWLRENANTVNLAHEQLFITYNEARDILDKELHKA